MTASLLALLPATNHADTAVPGISEGRRFIEQDGASLYQAICQSCHMPNGQGAQGAGMYPALAGNAKLVAGMYPAITVLKGRKGMPAFGAMLSDEQIALVANYVRSNLGNSFPAAGAVTAADVKSMR